MTQTPALKKIIVASFATAGLTMLFGCDSSTENADQADSPIIATVPGHNEQVDGVAGVADPKSHLAEMANYVATFEGDSAELAVRAGALDQAASNALPLLPADLRGPIGEDVESMRAGVDAGDWEAAQEAAASIGEKLDSAETK